MFVSAARDFPDRRFLRWCRDGELVTWTYAEAALRVASLVAKLDEAGVAHGDHVVIHTAEMVPSILFDLACACAGVVFTPIETTSLPAVVELCERTAARAVLTTPDRTNPYGRTVLVETGTAAVVGDRGAAITALARRAERVDRDTIYMLQPTSGTTGTSKLVIRTHAAFVRVPALLAPGVDRQSDPPARVLMVPALTHGMGQYLMAIGVSAAAEFCVTTRIDVGADLAEIRWLDPTYIALTPRVLRSLFEQRGGSQEPLFGPSVRHFLSGGAAPETDQLAAIAQTGVHVIEGFGASEISIVAVTRPGQWRSDIVGHVVDDVTLRVTDEGELEAWTPVMMRGYHNSPEASRAAFTEDGFYRTGDRVAIGPGGEFRYLGRLVDSFNLFDGSHVEPEPIEDAMLRLPWVDQVLLIGDQRPYLVGLVVVRDTSPSLRRTIERDVGRIGARLPPNARVRRLAILDQPFSEDLYSVVGHGKIRRARAKGASRYAALVEALYGAAPPDGATLIDIPGAQERQASSRHALVWLLRVQAGSETVEATTSNVSRSGAFVEDASLRGEIGVEILDPERPPLALDAVVVRHDATGVAIRWLGPPAALAELARRIPP